MNIIEKFASTKFGVMLFVIYVLYDTANKQPDNATLCLYIMSGLSVFYCIIQMVDRYLETHVCSGKKENELPENK